MVNSNGAISFRLNEAADTVKIISNGGTNDLGARPAGLTSRTLSVTGAFQVVVFKAAPAGFVTPVGPNLGAVLPISPDTTATRFFSPRGIAVNNNPASRYFGRIYVANATSGTVSNGVSGLIRNVGDGLYALNADFTDALGQEDIPLTGGLDFATGLDLSPYRLTVGQDDNLYVSDFSDTTGGLYVVDPNIAPGSGTNVLGGLAGSEFPVGTSRIHGSIAAAVVEGTLAASNLVAYVIDEDLQTDRTDPIRQILNSLWRHNLLDTLPGGSDAFPDILIQAPWLSFASQTMDLSRGTNGNFYVNTYRSPGTDWAGLYVHDPQGLPLWNSLAATRDYLNDSTAADLLRATGGGAVSPNGDFAAVINLETSVITIVPLLNGVPDLTNHLVFQGFSAAAGQGRDVAFDAAGNLYAISSGEKAMRVFSPGGKTTAITGSDGSFRVIRPPRVSIVAALPDVYEGGEDADFIISRTGDLSGELTVFFDMDGTATKGVDYATNAFSVKIPKGVASMGLIVAIVDDTLAEPVETLAVTLLGSPNYDLQSPTRAAVAIVDNDPATIQISAIDAIANEGVESDTLSFLIERTGQTNSELFVNFSTAGGTAIRGVDYSVLNNGGLSSQIHLAPGQINEVLWLAPIDDSIYEGNETVVITILPGSNYVPGPTNAASGIILDDESPPAVTLFADDFETNSATNWITRVGANNGIYDAEVKWAFDYSALGIPPAPHSASNGTRGLFVQLNKTNSSPGGSAGINFYPAGRSFSGNFQLQFDMLLNFGVNAPAEHALAGLNHSSLLTNRVTQSTDANNSTRGGDGVFIAIASDSVNNRDWAAYAAAGPDDPPKVITSRDAGSVAALITSPPYSEAGLPSIGPFDAKIWAEVELGQSNSIVTLKVNNAIILSFTNTSGYTGGNVMIGHNDQFDSIGSGGTDGNFVLFDNVRVVTPGIYITSVHRTGNVMQIDFVSPSGQASNFHLQTTPALSPASWADDNSAGISQTAQGFRFVVARNGNARFYRIRR